MSFPPPILSPTHSFEYSFRVSSQVLTLHQTFRQASPKRPKDTEPEGDSKVDNVKSNTEDKVNDVAGPKATAPSSQGESKPEAQENAAAGGQLTADKVRLHLLMLFHPGNITTAGLQQRVAGLQMMWSKYR